MADKPKTLGELDAERVAVFVAGVLFLITMIVIALLGRDPTAFQWHVFNLVLALAAGGFSAFLPGAIHVKLTPWLRASGALAVTAAVYFISPASLAGDPPPKDPPPATQANDVAAAWVSRMDAGAYEDAWAQASPEWKQRMDAAQWVELSHRYRMPLGSVTQRVPGGQYADEIRMGRRLNALTVRYATQFEHYPHAIEEDVALVSGGPDEPWKVAGYTVGVGPEFGTQTPRVSLATP